MPQLCHSSLSQRRWHIHEHPALLIAAKLQSQSRAEGLRKCASHTQWTFSVIKKNKVMDIIASVNWGCLQITNIICYLLYLDHRNICIYKYTLYLLIYDMEVKYLSKGTMLNSRKGWGKNKKCGKCAQYTIYTCMKISLYTTTSYRRNAYDENF